MKENEYSTEIDFEPFGVQNMAELYQLFFKDDQELMKSGQWDYENLELVINQIKEAVEAVDSFKLNPEDRKERESILHLWYHHATSKALGRKDWQRAQEFSDKAIEMQSGREFETTKLLNLLAYHKLDEAMRFQQQMTVDRDTGKSLIEDYEQLIKS